MLRGVVKRQNSRFASGTATRPVAFGSFRRTTRANPQTATGAMSTDGMTHAALSAVTLSASHAHTDTSNPQITGRMKWPMFTTTGWSFNRS